ncbi:MAG: fimbrial protein precursor [uncultured bacterium]|nr:MAG: fimbrial protein precursor [uncultured bacterium]
MQKSIGFSLIEIMFVLIITSILTALCCLPIYSKHLTHAKRLEAEMNLIKLASALEQYYIVNHTYQNASLNALNFPEKIAHDQYQLVIDHATESDFMLKAVPLNQQARNDPACAILLLSSKGEKGITGTGQLANCWV